MLVRRLMDSKFYICKITMFLLLLLEFSSEPFCEAAGSRRKTSEIPRSSPIALSRQDTRARSWIRSTQAPKRRSRNTQARPKPATCSDLRHTSRAARCFGGKIGFRIWTRGWAESSADEAAGFSMRGQSPANQSGLAIRYRRA